MATKRIKLYFHGNYSTSEIAEVYASDLGVDWDKDDDRWFGIFNFSYEVAIEVDVDLDTGEVTRVSN